MGARFESKVVIVTGAAGGIGRAAAVRFASEGASVVAVDLPDQDLAATTRLVEDAGGRCLAAPADVTNSAEVAGYVDAAVHTYGGVDALFNNAGIEGVVTPLIDYPEDRFDQVVAVNLKGIWLGMKYAAPAMMNRGGGSIVNTSSIGGLIAWTNTVPYIATKHAVIGMTKAAALEFAPRGVRVNAVCPGPIGTGMLRRLVAGIAELPADVIHSGGTVPIGRPGAAEEVAALVSFLCSEDAEFITGAAYPVDGGYLAL